MASRIVPLAAGLLLGLAAPVFAADAGALAKDLRGPDRAKQRAAYYALLKTPPRQALPHLRRNLPASDTLGQYYGVLLLEAYPPRDARRTWRALLAAEPPYLRFCAGLALARRGDETAGTVAGEALADEGAGRAERMWMIARVSVSAPPAVLASLRGIVAPRADLALVRLALLRLHERRDRPAMVQATRLLADSRAGARAMAAAYVLALGHRQGAGTLAQALREAVGIHEWQAVDTMLGSLVRVPRVVLEAMAARLADERNPYVKRQIAGMLARHRHVEGRGVLLPLLDDPNPAVARAAFDAIVTLSGPLVRETLLPLLEHPEVDRRLWAAQALRRRDDPAGLGTVVYALQSGTDPQRLTAARILGGYRADDSVEPLLDAMDDRHAGVRAQAAASAETVLTRLFPYRRLQVASTGYGPDKPARERRMAIDAVRRWWRLNREKDW